MRSYPALLALTAAPALLAPRVASAQTTTPEPLQGALWQPSLALEPDAMPRIEGTRVPGRWNWNAGVALQVLERPYTVHDLATGRTAALVHYQLWSHYLVQLGIARNMALGLELPVLLSQNGDRTVYGQSTLGNVGFGDVRGVFRWSTRSAAPAGGPGGTAPEAAPSTPFANEGPALSAVLAVTAPSGEGRALTGAGAWQVHPTVLGDFRLFGLILAGQLGYRFRFDSHWPGQGAVCGAEVECVGGVGLRDAITWGAGVRMPQGLLGGVASAYFEAIGQIDARRPFTGGTTPVELGIGAQRAFGEFTATLGVSTGVTDTPGNPRVRAMAMLQWAPRFLDEDGDGLRDNTGEDQCVGLPEDRDGYQDNDGCPEDNDNDDIPDAEDRCPTQDEDADGFQDEDGCPDPDNDSDGVPDSEDQCRDTAMGPNPDERRAGCPNDDIDGDGVWNTEDQCPEQPQGPTPDPARAGCPLADADRDGVPDTADACPQQPAGEGATAEQRGCPDPDRDHDGVLDANDRCVGQAETLNGVDDADGCPESPAPRGARPRVRIVNATATTPGTVELLEPVRFTAADQVDRASEPLLSQLAIALLATSRNPDRYYTLTVAQTPARVRGPAAIDAARATRRRDAVLAALRTRGLPEWAARPADPAPAPAVPPRVDRGIVLTLVDQRPTAAPTSPAPTTPPNSATTTPPNSPPNSAPHTPPSESAPASSPPASPNTSTTPASPPR